MSIRSLSRIVAGTCVALFWSCLFSTLSARGQVPGLDNLDRLESGRTKAENALWIENPLSARFNSSKRVVVADVKGPAEITMIHFAVPASQVSDPIRKLDRELALQMFWDGEATPSVNVPLVDFFGDPAGLREEVNTALVNKRRGFNFSWGFPPTESQFPLTGFFPFHKGAAAYRFFLHDAITFEKSLRVAIGFGEHEDPMFRREFSRRGNALQFSSTVYWYQSEPHAPLPALPPVAERAPAPEQPFWPDKELGAATSR
jgi:hypothetical protein